jgi:hypothetical protein
LKVKSQKSRWLIYVLLSIVLLFTYIILNPSFHLISTVENETAIEKNHSVSRTSNRIIVESAKVPITFNDITSTSGLEKFFRPAIKDSFPSPRYPQVMGGGVAVADYNNDGWEDIFLTGMPPISSKKVKQPEMTSSLFQNIGENRFIPVTKKVGLDGIKGFPQGALFFDFNNDGWQDLYIAAYDGGQLFKNVEGTYYDITDQAGLNLKDKCGELPCFSSSATSADYNRDGLLDLLIINNASWDRNDPNHQGKIGLFPHSFEQQDSFLFKNMGDGSFKDVTQKSGLNNEKGKGLAAIWTDINHDGWDDVYIANDLSFNNFYVNNRDGTFSEMATGMNLDEEKSSMGIDISDFDNNGEWDIAVTNLKHYKLSFYLNESNMFFSYVTDSIGLMTTNKATGWGVEFVDMNLDGFEDMVMASGPIWDVPVDNKENIFFRNLGNGTFKEEVQAVSGRSVHSVSRGLATIDINKSGKPDLVFANIDDASPQLLQNTTESSNNWLKINLQGTESNRDAIGARVVLNREDGLSQMQEVRAGNSYQSSGTKSLFFGLGASEPDILFIHWPSGKTDTMTTIAANQILKITE